LHPHWSTLNFDFNETNVCLSDTPHDTLPSYAKFLFYSWHFSVFRPCRHQTIIETLRFTTTIEVTDLQPRDLYELDVEADAQAVMG
jgi:hypothetical protein